MCVKKFDDVYEKEQDRAPLWHEAYARQEIAYRIMNRLDPFYKCPICHTKFN
jgi:hypothetical protein